MIASGACHECGRKVGTDHGTSPWKHAVYCLNVPYGPVEQAIGRYKPAADAGDPRASRIVALAEMEVM